jgi:hypothetical protein
VPTEHAFRRAGPRPALHGRTLARAATRYRLAASVLPGLPEEQSLFASLRLHFADFPYLPCSTRLEAAHLGDLLRLSVRPAPTITIVPPDFQGHTQALWTRTPGPCSASQCSPSRTESIPGCIAHANVASRRRLSTRKEISPQGLRVRLRVQSRCRFIAAAGSGILTGFPFDAGARAACAARRTILTAVACVLGSTHPCPIAVHMEPCSTSVFKVPI